MQGFYQVSSFHIPQSVGDTETDSDILVDYAVISRRSRDRAGLRYQRRGVDDEANVANFVETETLMRVEVGVDISFTFRLKTVTLREMERRMSLLMSRFEVPVGRYLKPYTTYIHFLIFSSIVLDPVRLRFEAASAALNGP